MDQDIVRRTDADVARNGEVEHAPAAGDAEQKPADGDQKRDTRLTRRVHVVLGLVIAVLGAWLLYRSRTELAFRGPNNEPGPGYLPVLSDDLLGRPRVWRCPRSGCSAPRRAR